METILIIILVSAVVSSCICLLFFLMLRSKLEKYLSLTNMSVSNCSKYFDAIKKRYPKNQT
ncbi:MAG: hypothetical protein RR571_05525 [Anaerorhabdus sp.]|uniref:hypothetical protein n=1 Tax=Anaerorhabdus sp. TaxID=1872524 RepID=UPI002FCAEAAA